MDNYNYVRDGGKYYIKISVNASIEQIRSSFDFRTSIGEIIEATMDRQVDQSKLAYLLLNDSRGKRRIIDSECGIDQWNSAYEALYQKSLVNERVMDFFKANDLSGLLLDTLKKIDFSDTLNLQEYGTLKEALIEIGKDIEDLNGFNEQISIDVRSCIKEEFSKYRDSEVDLYRINCYCFAVNNVESRRTFLEDCEEFRCYDIAISGLENKVCINFDKILKSRFTKYDPTVTYLETDIDKIYTSNYHSVIQRSGLTRDELDLYLQNKPCVKSILYFEVSENLVEDFKTFCINERKKTEDSIQQDESNDNDSGMKTSTVETTLSPDDTDNYARGGDHRVKSEKSKKGYENETANKEKAGKKAEQIAYTELKKDYPKLIWHSKNSDVPADKNKGPVDIVCDMWNIDSNNVKTYFEIKSATTEFEMSINEYNSMLSVPKEYIVVLVNIATGEISKHYLDELNGLKQVSKYKFCFTQEKSK